MAAMHTDVKAGDIMRKNVIKAADTETVAAAARLMVKNDVGCIIVVNKAGKPVGIVTERDVVKRVAAEDLSPSTVKLSKVMSKPLVSVDPALDIAEAMKRMKKSNIRRLVVIEKGEMVGILSDKDILYITPALIDVVAEQSRITAVPVRERQPLAGRCDMCDEWSDDLKDVEGKFICDDCRSDTEDKNSH
jgi:CBS domain-containing protein